MGARFQINFAALPIERCNGLQIGKIQAHEWNVYRIMGKDRREKVYMATIAIGAQARRTTLARAQATGTTSVEA
ncbi:hypothetical protein TorRG33x02_096400 [Trema orientale]|uniref:Uncharacterized protein n=1 Tax=Trema orientale TaxID=63057 RepID=A0A2P5F9Z4_TREOI|nr:hypothetical protein TorRG33x02_096400 [Trema orientale]